MSDVKLAQQRVYAWLIDGLVSMGLAGLFAWTGLMGWIPSAAYFSLRDGLFEGQSVGKRVLGLRLVMLPDEAPCNFLQSVIRNFLWVLFPVNFVVGLTGLHYLFHDAAGRL